jgi:hypothetical protein
MPSTTLQILTPSGSFEAFDGVKRYKHFECCRFVLSSGKVIRTALDHRFIINDQTVYAQDVVVGVNLSTSDAVISIERENLGPDGEWFYDPVNVANGSIFCHDETLISHNTFLGNSNTLLSSVALLGLMAHDPISRHNEVRFYEEPKEFRSYIVCVDVAKGRGQDFSTCTAIDVTERPFRQVATFRSNIISPLLLPDVAVRMAKIFNQALILVENNDVGVVVCNAIYYEYEYENLFVESSVKAGGIGVTMTKRVKREGCSNLKDLIETGNLQVVDADTISELSSFEADGVSYAAAPSCHDDLVMNLVLFSWYVSTPMFREISDVDLRNLLFAERLREMEEDVPFVGYFPKTAEVALSPEMQIILQARRDWSLDPDDDFR